MIRDAQELWLRGALEDGWIIPEPRSDGEYSGKFKLRVPRSVHRDLVLEAREQGVSLNLLAATALARATGAPHAGRIEIAGRPAVANGRHPQDTALPAGILEQLGSLHQQLVVANARLSEGVPCASSEVARVLAESKDTRQVPRR